MPTEISGNIVFWHGNNLNSRCDKSLGEGFYDDLSSYIPYVNNVRVERDKIIMEFDPLYFLFSLS